MARYIEVLPLDRYTFSVVRKSKIDPDCPIGYRNAYTCPHCREELRYYPEPYSWEFNLEYQYAKCGGCGLRYNVDEKRNVINCILDTEGEYDFDTFEWDDDR